MTLCPFCKSAKIDDHAPCPRCGRSASGAPAPGPAPADGWGDDGELSRGGHHASSGGPSAYAGGGIGFGDDDPFADDAPAGSLELDLPANPRSSSHEPAAPGPAVSAAPGSGAHAAAPSVRTPSAPAFAPSVEAAPTPPRASVPDVPASSRTQDPAALIARFPLAPTKLWETPVYALKVLFRQLELRQDLTSLRRRRSPDVPLYERALRAHDAKTFTIGLALAGAAFALACFLFFLPVLFRFLRAPD